MKSVTLEEQMAFQTPFCFVDTKTNDCNFFPSWSSSKIPHRRGLVVFKSRFICVQLAFLHVVQQNGVWNDICHSGVKGWPAANINQVWYESWLEFFTLLLVETVICEMKKYQNGFEYCKGRSTWKCSLIIY